MAKHGFRLSKSFGQNLLTDKNIIDKIVDAGTISPGDTAVEIGPGIGALTVPLAVKAERVICIEVDGRIIPLLREATDGAGDVRIEHCDFMKYDTSLLPASGCKLYGNLPYYITTPIIMKVLEGSWKPDAMVFMVQKEVAERIASPPGSKVYGAISVSAQYHAQVDYIADVSRNVFLPKPDVDSAVIRFLPGQSKVPRAVNEKLLFTVIKAGFLQRRKMLKNSLKNAGIAGPDMLDAAFAGADIDTKIRAEELSAGDYVRLADELARIKN